MIKLLLTSTYKVLTYKKEVIKSNFRNKDISFSLDSIIKFNPFFNVISKIDIKEINEDLFEKFYLYLKYE